MVCRKGVPGSDFISFSICAFLSFFQSFFLFIPVQQSSVRILPVTGSVVCGDRFHLHINNKHISYQFIQSVILHWGLGASYKTSKSGFTVFWLFAINSTVEFSACYLWFYHVAVCVYELLGFIASRFELKWSHLSVRCRNHAVLTRFSFTSSDITLLIVLRVCVVLGAIV